jgi:hypothetical protein
MARLSKMESILFPRPPRFTAEVVNPRRLFQDKAS